MFGTFAVLALGMAGVGLYGIMSQTVAQRTREIGIRLALGAAPLDLSRMVVREAMTLVAAGLAIGSAAAMGLSQVIAGLLSSPW